MEYKINIKRIVYAKLTKDDSTGCTYETPKALGSPRSIEVSPVIATGDCYGGGAREKSINKIVGMDVSIDVNKISIDVRKDLFGHKSSSDGTMVIGSSDQPVEIALGYEIEQTGNRRELVWLLKGTAQPPSEKVNQTEGTNINFSTDSIKFSFVQREFDKQFMSIGDTDIAEFTEETANTYLDSVPVSFTFESTGGGGSTGGDE